MAKAKIIERDLYVPVKAFLTAQGYDVKGEVGAADIVAMRAGDIIIVELKTGFSLSLFHQAINRQSMTDQVYVCVPSLSGKAGLTSMRKNKMLCRRLGIGLLTVKVPDGKVVEHVTPGAFTPRKIKKRKTKLIDEFERRHGDPNAGGMTMSGVMTTYRQGALRCAKVLHDEGACKGSYVAKMAGVDKATSMMANNHYGWFERIETGIYGLTPDGAKALTDHAKTVASMMEV